MLGLICVPAKYSCPGSPMSLGEQVNVCRKTRFSPAHASRSKAGFIVAQGTSFQCLPMVVNDSAPTNCLLYICAALDACFTKNRSSGLERCGDGDQNSLITISLYP